MEMSPFPGLAFSSFANGQEKESECPSCLHPPVCPGEAAGPVPVRVGVGRHEVKLAPRHSIGGKATSLTGGGEAADAGDRATHTLRRVSPLASPPEPG